jgi:hypothetical protein
MTFEPLIQKQWFESLGSDSLWAVIVALAMTGLAYLLLRKSTHPEAKAGIITAGVASLVVTFLGVGMITGTHEKTVNMDRVASNVTKKYDVDQFSFSTPDRNLFPAQTEPQEVKIRHDGKTITAWLKQDFQTSEPTLLDFDSGKPLDNLLVGSK